MGAVAILELDGLGTCSQSNKLVAHAYAHDRDLGRLEQLAEVVHSGRAVSRVTRAIGDEDAVKVVGDLMDGVVEGEASDAGTTGDEAAKDVLLHTAVDQGDVHVTERRADMEGRLGGDTTDQVDSLRVNVGLVFISIVLFSNGNAGQRRTLLTEVCHDFTRVDTRNSGDTLTGTPLSKGLNGSPVAMLHCVVLDNNARSLDVGRLKIAEQAMFIASGRRYSVVTNQRLGKDENLATVGGIGHRLWVSNKGGGEDGFAGDVGLGAERLASEDRPILTGGE